jgi:hypothetical protein
MSGAPTIPSASSSPPLLLERADIHKSCKTIEQIVNLLNDYCEATNSMLQIQKKLFKALKDAAGTKGATEAGGESLFCI